MTKRKARAKKQPKPTAQELRDRERKMEDAGIDTLNALFGMAKEVYKKLTAEPEPKPEPPKPKTGRELLPPFLRE